MTISKKICRFNLLFKEKLWNECKLLVSVVIWLYPKNAPIHYYKTDLLIEVFWYQGEISGRTAEGVNLAAEIAELPWAAHEEIVNGFRDESDH